MQDDFEAWRRSRDRGDRTPDPVLALNAPELRPWVLGIWGLYLAAAVSAGSMAVLGVIAAYWQRQAARGTLWESHLEAQIRTFWISTLIFLASLVLWLVLLGWLAWLGLLVYYLWRSGTGLLRALDWRPYRDAPLGIASR